MGVMRNITHGKETANRIAASFDGIISISEEEKKELQQILLKMYDDIACVCKKHNIIPMLVGGSALGAIRHQGFIPWDDDLDIALSRKDYHQFQLVFEQELSEKYVLNAPIRSKAVRARFPKILKKGTVLREINDVSDPEAQGVFLDIFIIENAPDNPLLRKIKGILCNALEFIAGQVQLRENCDILTKRFYLSAGKSNYYIRRIVGTVFSMFRTSRWMMFVDRAVQCNNPESKYCTLATGRKHYLGEMLERSVLFPACEGVFEGRKVFLPSNPDAYLKNLYGDYMTIPPIEKREQHFIREIRL